MSNITTLPKAEIEKVSKQFSADAGYTYNERLLITIDDCVNQYNKAEEVSRIAQMVIKDRMQGSALLKAKKLICGDEWNNKQLSHLKSEKWKEFLQTLGCPYRNSQYLLDFAGYKEAEDNLIAQGIEITPIATASHYREVKKLTDINTPEAVATTYTQAVEANGGNIPRTAKEVKEVINTSKNKISSEELFLREFPEYEDIESPHNDLKVDDFISRKLPRVSKDKWKHFYKLVAKIIHPDKGGNEDDMSILTGLNEVYDYLRKQEEISNKSDEKYKAYEDWCKDYGCNPHDWVEDVNS